MAGCCSLKLIFKEVWILLCLLGNVLQIYQISDIFFAYEAVTVADVSYPSRLFSYPTLNICLYIIDIVKWEEAFEVFPDLKSDLGYEDGTPIVNFTQRISREDHLGKLNLSSMFVKEIAAETAFQLTLDGREIFENCSIADPKTYRMVSGKSCPEVFDIRTYFRECYKCFAFTAIGTPQYDFKSVSRIIGSNALAFDIEMFPFLANDRVNQAQIYYSSTNTLPRHGIASNIFVTDLNSIFRLTYECFVNILLPPPYETGCRNYSLDGFENKGQCYENCARNKSTERFKAFFPGPAIETFRRDKMLSINYMHGDAYTKMQEIQAECDQLCGAHDCHEQIYIPNLLVTMDSVTNSFSGYFQRTPTVRTIFIPKLDLTEYLTQVGSTFGFWTGVSLFGIFDLIDILLQKIKKPNKKSASKKIRGNRSSQSDYLIRSHVVQKLRKDQGYPESAPATPEWSPQKQLTQDMYSSQPKQLN